MRKKTLCRATGLICMMLLLFLGREGVAAKNDLSLDISRKQPQLAVQGTNSNRLKLSWKKMKNAQGYVVLRATKKSGTYKKIAATKKQSYVDKKTISGKTYFYRMYAYGKKRNGKTNFSRLSQIRYQTVSLSPTVVKEERKTAGTCTIRWEKISMADRYIIFRSKKREGPYKKCGITKKNNYLDRHLKSRTTYYYKVVGQGKNKAGFTVMSRTSKAIGITTKKKVKKIAYVGDSVIAGLSEYRVITESNHKVFYKIGVSPYSFYNGTLLDSVLDYNPDRMYIMLGMNSLVGTPSNGTMESILKYYRLILEECLYENPEMEIIILPVSPTKSSATVRNAYINRFNRKLKSLAKDMNLEFFDCMDFLKTKDGTLKSDYAEGDGIHWKISAYRKLKDCLYEHDKQIA